ncbi:CTP synthetase [Pseudohalocynthiibacter aestuariivivens]|nr:CTP synthetase [Pseudohalocynthiibacter aestuariivivens]QIE47099.1 CTP synthetase [Pseudohalocynthiibacter aestuariivivens]
MGWLITVLHLFIGATLAGIGVIAALVMGHASVPVLLGAALVGFVAAAPVSWLLARKLLRRD